jgi:hypothetical protein
VERLAVAPGSRSEAGRRGTLNAVAAASARNAWAVGVAGDPAEPRPLILRWNGTRWRPVPSPAPPGGTLNGVAVASATSAWAVGSLRGAALIEHWNGRTWNQVRGPASSILRDVDTVSPGSAWAVGYNNGHGNKTLILRMTDSTWTQVRSPSPSRRSGALAVGSAHGGTGTILIEHWDGWGWAWLRRR